MKLSRQSYCNANHLAMGTMNHPLRTSLVPVLEVEGQFWVCSLCDFGARMMEREEKCLSGRCSPIVRFSRMRSRYWYSSWQQFGLWSFVIEGIGAASSSSGSKSEGAMVFEIEIAGRRL